MKIQLFLTGALLLMLQGCSSNSEGRIINKPGIHNLGGQPELTAKIATNSEGKLRLTLSGGGIGISPETDLHDNWFVFPDSSGRVWYFNGTDDLSALSLSEKLWTSTSILKDESLRNEIPKEILVHLPEVLRVGLNAEQSPGGDSLEAAPQE